MAGLNGRGQQILIELVKQGVPTLDSDHISELFKGLFAVGSEEALIEVACEIKDVDKLSKILIDGLSLPQTAVAYQMGRLRPVLASRGMTFNGDTDDGRIREILFSQIAQVLRVIYDKIPIKVTEVRRLLEDIEGDQKVRESKQKSLESKQEAKESMRLISEQRQPELHGFIQDWITAYLTRCKRHDQLRKSGRGSELFMLATDSMGVPPLLKEVLPERLMKYNLTNLQEMTLSIELVGVPETEVSLEGIRPHLPMLKQYLEKILRSYG